jgi:molybdenum cofactor cytidylyltransferase
VFDDLLALHGDKAVWKLLESDRYPVQEVVIDGNIPLDVDTWQDYQALLAAVGGEPDG